MKHVRHVYNDDFYKITAVLISKKFLALEKDLQNNYSKSSLSIPEKGFSSEKAYRDWLKKALTLPTSPGKRIEDILVKFNLDPKNEYYRSYLTARLLFHKMPWEQSLYTPIPIELLTEIKNPSKGIWVKIHPWTKKEDYVSLWPSINNLQRTHQEYRNKEKFQVTFERNFAVYQLYLEAKRDIETNGNPNKLSTINKMATLPDYEFVRKRFNGGDFSDNLRSITSDFKERLADINIL